MILVTGASGTVGREVVAQLIALGQPIRALTREPAKARFDAKAQVVQGDLANPDTLPRALDGVDRVFSLSTGPDLGAHETNLAAAAKKAGAKQIVKLSALGVGNGSDNALARWHEEGEKAVQSSGLAWTLVRPGMFMSNAFSWAPSIKSQGKVFLPYGNGKVAPIHPRDIAAVAVKALTSAGHDGKTYELTGPETLSAAEMVEALSEAVGKPIGYVAAGEGPARENMLKAGMPAVVVDSLLKWSAGLRAGEVQPVLPTAEQVLGRKPLTWREWAHENAPAFAETASP